MRLNRFDDIKKYTKQFEEASKLNNFTWSSQCLKYKIAKAKGNIKEVITSGSVLK